jgi:serine/threonine-protein kinase
LAKRPEDRFQDAESLEQALSECAADRWTQSDAARWWREHDQATTATREMIAAATA